MYVNVQKTVRAKLSPEINVTSSKKKSEIKVVVFSPSIDSFRTFFIWP